MNTLATFEGSFTLREVIFCSWALVAAESEHLIGFAMNPTGSDVASVFASI